MDENQNLTASLDTAMETGNVTMVLSLLSAGSEEELEAKLQTGKSPWQLAEELNVLDAFWELVFARMLNQLDFIVHTGQISQQQADELVAHFEMTVPAEKR